MGSGEKSPGTLPPVHEAWLPREHSLYRPRHGVRQIAALACAAVFFAGPTFLRVAGVEPAEIENHPLAEMPSISDGWGFFSGFDEWANDNLSFRAGAVSATDWVSRTIFGEPPAFDLGGHDGGGPLGDPHQPPEQQRPDDKKKKKAPSVEVDVTGFARVIEGSDGWMYFGVDIAAKCKPTRSIDDIATQLGALREAVEASGRKFVLIPVPDKTTMVPDHLPKTYPGKSCASKASPVFWRKIAKLPRVLDLRSDLRNADGWLGDPPYFKQDSHWTHEGSLVMVEELAERVQRGVSDKWKIDARGQYTGAADLPPMIGRTGEKNGTKYSLAPDGRTNRARESVHDLTNPVRISGDPIEGQITKRTIMLGDSFAIAASPYLPAAFADVTIIDYSSIPVNRDVFLNAIADHEVVVFEVAERNLAGGKVPMLDQGFIDGLRTTLAQRPVR